LSILSEFWPIDGVRKVMDKGLEVFKSLLTAEENFAGE